MLTRIIRLGEGVGDPEEGWCVVDPLTSNVLQGPYLDKSKAVSQSKTASVTSRLKGTAPQIKYGKQSNGEYVATRAITEGPLDYIRGAAKQVAPAVRNVAQAGRQTSAVSDLTKAVTALVQLLQAEAQQKTNAPAPQYQQAGRPAQPTGTSPQMSTQPQMTFASYLQDVEGDRLDEGAWDAIKSGASAIARGIGGAARAAIDPDGPIAKSFRAKFANDPWLTNVAKAAAAHRSPPATVQQQKQYQLQQIQKILQRTQNPQQALKKVLGQVAGSGAVANQIYAMIFPAGRPAQPAPQQTVRTNTQWQQGQQPTPRQQPARTFGPGKRRARPTGTQP